MKKASTATILSDLDTWHTEAQAQVLAQLWVGEIGLLLDEPTTHLDLAHQVAAAGAGGQDPAARRSGAGVWSPLLGSEPTAGRMTKYSPLPCGIRTDGGGG